jgi:uncharacterized protein YdeI (YjbR/CyaY-like superfamily)
MEKTASVDGYIAKNPQWESELKLLRTIFLETGLEETIKWGAPVYTLRGKNIAGLAAFKNYTSIWFFNGALLKDVYGVLVNAQEGKTKAMRQWRFKNSSEISREKILAYLEEAIQNEREGKRVVFSRDSAWNIPAELEKALAEDERLHEAFHTLSKYQQKEYAAHVQEGKQPETKQKRLEKIKPMIMQGIGLHDRYKKR